MQRGLSFLLAFVFAAVMLVSSCVFTVDQRQFAVVFQFGEIVNVYDQPGLAAKLPFVQNVRFYDKRILTLDSNDPDLFFTAENNPILVDAYVKWRIRDVRKFYISLGGGDEGVAETRIDPIITSSLREEFGRRSMRDTVTADRDDIMTTVLKKASSDRRISDMGVEVVDVRIKRIELPTTVSDSVYGTMETERKRVANELRSQGVAAAEKIKADADRQREVILADAYRDAQKIKGEGDAKAAAIYAQAFGQNPEFYAFYRSLEAYRSSFKNKGDVLVVEPNSEFFKYLKGAGRGGK
ncbi:MAG TPA: protease modulator HflC [Rhodocyclaceae bacterium]|jgi:membrane protease subunit HflC|nr:protease modulator HflC [Rhodocyclaceae bacterium]